MRARPSFRSGRKLAERDGALALGIGFSYFMLLAFARALGQNGTLPPMAAAWVANVLYTAVGVYLVLGAE